MDKEIEQRGANSAYPWHASSTDAALAELSVSTEGLDDKEAVRRRQEFGFNRLSFARRRGFWKRLLGQLHNALIYVLLASGVVTAALSHWLDSSVILGVVVINTLIGLIQEGKAERALEAIRGMLTPTALVLRGGKATQIPSEDLVPGDLVLLQPGDRVSADLRLFQARELEIDESVLTGESLPATKQTAPVGRDAPLAERACMAYSGTLVTRGQGRGVAVATGENTELGRISELLRDVEPLVTPLLRKITVFGQTVSIFIVILALMVAGFGIVLRDLPVEEMLLAAVSIAVAAIPEGLPAVISIALAIGVQRMARRSAIVRQLPAVETLGEVDVICTDKTGTLTRNEMTVRAVILADGTVDVTGTGYEPRGTFVHDGKDLIPSEHPVLQEALAAGQFCNDAELALREGRWTIHGDPTEGALLTVAAKAGLDRDRQARGHPRLDTLPFDSDVKYMASLHHDHAGRHTVYLKGAPETLLAMASLQRTAAGTEPLDRGFWDAAVENRAARGERVLALASRELPGKPSELQADDVGGGLVLLGMVAVSDPPRDEVRDAIAACRRAGIRVKMITGDHGRTALAIARELGMATNDRYLTGADLDAMEPDRLAAEVEDVDVFARTTPENKLQLVQALQAAGHVVAMTGDGVNDAPALKRADIGLAMGRKGTEAAKEAADVVLADDNFATIERAVEEGRTIYDNITKSIAFLLPTSLAEALVVALAILLGWTLPLTPLQILWVNMATAITLGIALGFESSEPGVMKRPPRAGGNTPILSPFILWRTVFVALILVIGTMGSFYLALARGLDLNTARTIAVNALVAFEAFYLLSCRSLLRPMLGPHALRGNRYVPLTIGMLVILQIAFTYTPWAHFLFSTAALAYGHWLGALAVALSVVVLVEAEKWLLSGRRARREHR